MNTSTVRWVRWLSIASAAAIVIGALFPWFYILQFSVRGLTTDYGKASAAAGVIALGVLIYQTISQEPSKFLTYAPIVLGLISCGSMTILFIDIWDALSALNALSGESLINTLRVGIYITTIGSFVLVVAHSYDALTNDYPVYRNRY